jgi:hypothetical protein
LSWQHKFIIQFYVYLRSICVTKDLGYVPLLVNTFRSFPHLWLVTEFVTRITRQVPLVEQELFTLPEHLSSPPVFSGVRPIRSLCVCFVRRCLSFCSFSFVHWVVCFSSFYLFWLPLWYLQTLLNFLLHIYFQLNFFISLLFHLFFLIATCSCSYSYSLMLTATYMCRPYLY